MAVSVSSQFKALWRQKQGTVEQVRVRYKRRYWTGSAFALEADWKVLSQNQLVRIGVIPQQLDSPRQNIFRTSVFSIFLPNTQNEWKQLAVNPSKFQADATATSGYRAYRTQVQVQTGYILADGTTEWVSRFTGVLLRTRISASGEAELILASNFFLLEAADAEQVSTTVTLENCIPATGDGSNKAFESTSTGVDRATAVQVNAVAQTQGSAYRTSNENQVSGGGNTGRLAIAFDTAPGNTLTVKVSLIKWLANQAIETVMGLLFDEAGFASGDRSISSVVFPGGVSSSKTLDLQADWAAGGVQTSVDTASLPGSVAGPWKYFDDWSDGLIAARTSAGAPEWTIQATNGNVAFTPSSGSVAVSASGIGVADNYIVATAPFTQATGNYKIRCSVTSRTPSVTDQVGSIAMFITNAYGGGRTLTGYGIMYDSKTSNIYLMRVDAEGIELGSILATLGTYNPGDVDFWDITRDGSGAMTVYRNGVSVGTATDNTYTASTYFTLHTHVPDTNKGMTLTVYGIYYSTLSSSFTGIWESAEQDLLAAPIAWSTLDRTITLNGGTLTFKTATATVSGGPYDSYVAIAADGTIQSALKRYLKIRAEFTPADNFGTFDRPVVDKLIARYSTSSVFLALAKLRGKTCAAACEDLARLADYYLGFKGDGTGFFRSKTITGAYEVHLTQENGIIEVLDYDTGIPDRVRNVGRVRSGGFAATYSCTDAAEASPTPIEEYGERVQDEDYEDFLLANDADIRTARARLIHDLNHNPPLRLRLSIWDMPWLELADIVRVSCYDHPRQKLTQLDDPLGTLRDTWMAAGEAQNVIARDLDMKVLELKPNLDTGRAEVLLEALA